MINNFLHDDESLFSQESENKIIIRNKIISKRPCSLLKQSKLVFQNYLKNEDYM